MKKDIRGKAKGALALALSVSLFSTTIFAAEPVAEPTAAQEGQTAEQGLPVLTYEDALAKAKKKNASLKDYEKMNEFLQESKEDLWDMYGSFNVPDYEYQRWVDDGFYYLVSSVYSTDSGLKKNKYAAGVTNLAVETTIKSTFSSILENQANLELLKQSADLKKKQYEQGKTKYNLGLISKYALDQLKAASDKAATDVAQLEMTLEQAYTNLNQLIGESNDKRFQLSYDVTFEPYVLNGSMEQYINAKLKSDYTILLKEQAVEDAKFGKNYLAESTDGSKNKSNTHSYEEAQRALKSAKEEKATDIRNAYVQLQQSEKAYRQAEADLVKAQEDLKAVEVNYQAGNITKMDVEQAEMGVAQAENKLIQLAYSYDLQVFQFENTSLIGGGSGAGAGAGGKEA